MRITYDKTADAAYIYLTVEIRTKVSYTFSCEDEELGLDGVNLDFDDADKLIGIEILNASKRLPDIVIERAQWFR